MERIESDVRRELGRLGARGLLPEVLEVWPGIVGPEISRNAWPARIARNGTLHVATRSSPWAFELSQLAPEILGRLEEQLGKDAPKELRFAPGHLPEPSARELAPELVNHPSPGPGELEEARELAASIDDEELRKRVQRAASLSLARSRSDR
jgi:hypothetical protein